MKPELKNSIHYIAKKAGKQSMHTIPPTYFNTIEDNVFTKISESSFSKEHGFSTPNYYFNTLENKILQKEKTSQKQGKYTVFKNNVLKYSVFATAACFILFFSIYNNFETNNNSININLLADNDIENWLEDNADHFTITLEDISFDENNFSLANIEEDSIEEYLQTTETLSILNEIN